ncbi:hypothetical protein C6502_06005 [Candidatus Poribacteria bacterium]|nr:MAG: hypothetical protein C6502_06005 [Candidatus Poribacteria bacterium]
MYYVLYTMLDKIRQTASQYYRRPSDCFDLVIYVGFLLFVFILPFGYATAILNASLLLVLFGWIGRICHERRFEWKRTPLDIPIAVFLLLALVASLFAPHPATSSLGYFWKLFRAVLLFYAVVHSRLGGRWRHVIITFVFAGGFSAILGLYFYATGTHMGTAYMFDIEAKLESHFSDAAYHNEGVKVSEDLRQVYEKNGRRLSQNAIIFPTKKYGDWLIVDKNQNRKYAIRKSEGQLKVYMIEPRLAGTFKMPNDLGAYLVIVLPMAIGYFVASLRSSKQSGRVPQNWKFIAVLGVLLCAMGANLTLTLTRAAWIGVFAATLYIAIYFQRKLLWGLLAIALLSPFLMPQAVKDRFEIMRQRPSGFMSERPQWWKTSAQLIAKHPITGIGLGRFRHEYQLHAPAGFHHKPYHAHNIYLHIAVEQGIPSLILFLGILFLIFRQLFALRKRDDFWCSGLFIGGSGFLISALVYGLADQILHQRPLLIFWFLVGVVFYVSNLDNSSAERVS